MGAPLNDITIYYHGTVIKDAPQDWDFRRKVNYIADFYHDSLNGFKPTKTGIICFHLGATNNWAKPNYFGSICSYGSVIDENKYLSLSKKEKYKYILEILHTTVIEIADIYSWDKSAFNTAYKHIIESDFKFEKHYPEKKSKDRKHVGQIILAKTEEKSKLSVVIKTRDSTITKVLLEKNNWYWFDSNYHYAKNCKWLDNSCFGIYKNGKNCYFSTEQNRTINDLTFNKDDF